VIKGVTDATQYRPGGIRGSAATSLEADIVECLLNAPAPWLDLADLEHFQPGARVIASSRLKRPSASPVDEAAMGAAVLMSLPLEEFELLRRNMAGDRRIAVVFCRPNSRQRRRAPSVEVDALAVEPKVRQLVDRWLRREVSFLVGSDSEVSEAVADVQ
jgi:hypothetical protein